MRMAGEERNHHQIALLRNVPIFTRNVINRRLFEQLCVYFSFLKITNYCTRIFKKEKKKKTPCNMLEIFLYILYVCIFERFTYTTWINIERAIGIFRVMALTGQVNEVYLF